MKLGHVLSMSTRVEGCGVSIVVTWAPVSCFLFNNYVLSSSACDRIDRVETSPLPTSPASDYSICYFSQHGKHLYGMRHCAKDGGKDIGRGQGLWLWKWRGGKGCESGFVLVGMDVPALDQALSASRIGREYLHRLVVLVEWVNG